MAIPRPRMVPVRIYRASSSVVSNRWKWGIFRSRTRIKTEPINNPAKATIKPPISTDSGNKSASTMASMIPPAKPSMKPSSALLGALTKRAITAPEPVPITPAPRPIKVISKILFKAFSPAYFFDTLDYSCKQAHNQSYRSC